MTTKTTALDKQVAEVRRTLTDGIKNGYLSSLDGRIGYALSKLPERVTEKNIGLDRYYLLTDMGRSTLHRWARAFCEANGMKELADAWDAIAMNRYVDNLVSKWQYKRDGLMKEIEEIDRKIAELEAQRLTATATTTDAR